MATNRFEILRNMLEQNPQDSFARYGLAMELANRGDLQQAVAEYRKLLEHNPNYAAAYFHGGQALYRRCPRPLSKGNRGYLALRRSAHAQRTAGRPGHVANLD